MINCAKNNSPAGISFKIGSLQVLKESKEKYDVITSIMVFQFIEDIEPYVEALYDYLNPKGILVIAVFNPDFVEKCAKNNQLFSKLIKTENGFVTQFLMGKQKIKTYIRTRSQYNLVFEKFGFKMNSYFYPPFTKEFVQKYNWSVISDVPEFLIMEFRK